MEKFGFIGCGNMGGALAAAVAEKIGGGSILLSDANRAVSEALAEKIGASVSDNLTIASECDFIVAGVKPQVCKALYNEISPVLGSRSNAVIISMAAGISTDRITDMLGFTMPIIRIMPNLAASVGEGMILYTSVGTDEEAIEVFKSAFSLCGVTDRIGEKLIDAASAVTGCGPAFVYMFIESLADAAVRCGIPRQKATLYASQTLLGSAKLQLTTGRHPEELKDAVCSPGGTTIAGVAALESGGFRAAVEDAVSAAYKRTLEL